MYGFMDNLKIAIYFLEDADTWCSIYNVSTRCSKSVYYW